MTVDTKKQAWVKAGEIFPTDYYKDDAASELFDRYNLKDA